MHYRLDTGVWVRAVTAQQTVPAPVPNLLLKPRETFGLSGYSLWEVGKKVQKGRLAWPKDLPAWFADALTNIELLPLTPEVVADAMRLPEFPNNDPGDELLVATARVHRLTLLTTDTKLKRYAHAKINYFTPVLEGKE